MQPIFARGNARTVSKLILLRKEALRDNEYRVATRLHAVILSIERNVSVEIANILKVSRKNIPIRIHNWNELGAEGLWEGHRSGRRSCMDDDVKEKLTDLIESGPVAYGLNTGVWTSKIIAEIIEEEFDIRYNAGHVRKLLKKIGFSVQRPTYKLSNANPKDKNKWTRYTYPNLKKTPRKKTQN
jgi:transposase